MKSIPASSFGCIFLCSFFLFPHLGRAEERALHNVPKAKGLRFEIPDRIWPENPGEADICLWKDDKLAAVSVTIDDNIAGQHAWWMEQGEKYGFRFTWFIITNWVENRGIGGTWADYQKLLDAGHDVQSHTDSHLSDKSLDIDDEYRISQEEIETHLPGHAAITLAYPGGGNSHRNDSEVAKKYYIAARGVRSVINPVNRVDYINVQSCSGTFVMNKPNHWANMGHLIDRSQGKKLYRGWYVTHFHGLKDPNRDHVLEAFEYIKAHENAFWLGLFREVAQYGQQRDTAEVKTVNVSPVQIELSLTDKMDDAIYNQPLTLKVRLPNDWRAVIAGQNRKMIESTFISHDNAPYALIQAVPDKGAIYLRQN